MGGNPPPTSSTLQLALTVVLWESCGVPLGEGQRGCMRMRAPRGVVGGVGQAAAWGPVSSMTPPFLQFHAPPIIFPAFPHAVPLNARCPCPPQVADTTAAKMAAAAFGANK